MASSPPSKRRRKNQSKDETDDPTAASSSELEKVSPVVVFAHGAGAPSSSDWMIRVTCMVACKEDIHASAIICLGYPLKGMNGAVRDESIL